MHPQVAYKSEQPQLSQTEKIISEVTSLKILIFIGFDKYLICFSHDKELRNFVVCFFINRNNRHRD